MLKIHMDHLKTVDVRKETVVDFTLCHLFKTVN